MFLIGEEAKRAHSNKELDLLRGLRTPHGVERDSGRVFQDGPEPRVGALPRFRRPAGRQHTVELRGSEVLLERFVGYPPTERDVSAGVPGTPHRRRNPRGWLDDAEAVGAQTVLSSACGVIPIEFFL